MLYNLHSHEPVHGTKRNIDMASTDNGDFRDAFTYCRTIFTNISKNVAVLSVGFELECRHVHLLRADITKRKMQWSPMGYRWAFYTFTDREMVAGTNEHMEIKMSFDQGNKCPFMETRTMADTNLSAGDKDKWAKAKTIVGPGLETHMTNATLLAPASLFASLLPTKLTSAPKTHAITMKTRLSETHSSHLEAEVLIQKVERRDVDYLWNYFTGAFRATHSMLTRNCIKSADQKYRIYPIQLLHQHDRSIIIAGCGNPGVNSTLSDAEWTPQMTIGIGIHDLPNLVENIVETRTPVFKNASIAQAVHARELTNECMLQLDKTSFLSALKNYSPLPRVSALHYTKCRGILKGFVFWVIWVVSTFHKLHHRCFVMAADRANISGQPAPKTDRYGNYKELMNNMRFKKNVLLNPRNSVPEMYKGVCTLFPGFSEVFMKEIVPIIINNKSWGPFYVPSAEIRNYDDYTVRLADLVGILTNKIPSMDVDSNVSAAAAGIRGSDITYSSTSSNFNMDYFTPDPTLVKVFFEYRGMGIIKAKGKRCIFTLDNIRKYG